MVAGVSRKKFRGQNGRCQASEAVNKSRAVILSEAKTVAFGPATYEELQRCFAGLSPGRGGIT